MDNTIVNKKLNFFYVCLLKFEIRDKKSEIKDEKSKLKPWMENYVLFIDNV